jgi:hypothetical protein
MRAFVPPPFLDYGVNHGVTIGSSGSGTPFHFHGDGWNELLAGRKRWFIFDLRRQPALVANGDFIAQVGWLVCWTRSQGRRHTMICVRVFSCRCHRLRSRESSSCCSCDPGLSSPNHTVVVVVWWWWWCPFAW